MREKIKTKKNLSVETMLSIKAEISEKFTKNPDLILKDLLAIREKYNLQSADRKKLSLTT